MTIVEIDSDDKRQAKADSFKGIANGLSAWNVLGDGTVRETVERDKDEGGELSARPAGTKRQTRSSFGNNPTPADFSYDMKWHPMDLVTRPVQAARRGLAPAHNRKGPREMSRGSTSTLGGDEDRQGDKRGTGRSPKPRRGADPKATRASKRKAAGNYVDYSRKHHPIDDYLRKQRNRASSTANDAEPAKKNLKRSDVALPDKQRSKKTKPAGPLVAIRSSSPTTSPDAEAPKEEQEGEQEEEGEEVEGSRSTAGMLKALTQGNRLYLAVTPCPGRFRSSSQYQAPPVGYDAPDHMFSSQPPSPGTPQGGDVQGDDLLDAFESVTDEILRPDFDGATDEPVSDDDEARTSVWGTVP